LELEGEWEEEDNWYSLDQVPTTSHLVKTGKRDPTDPRTYRPISLSSFLLKIQERMVGWEIEATSLEEYPMHKRQHAFRKGHSCDDAFTGTVNRIEHAMHNGQFAVAVFLDIRGAFDNITSDAIVLAMERHHIDPEIARIWCEFYLRNQLCELTLGDEKAHGIPQGGVLSPPIGWNLAFNKLLECYDNSSAHRGICRLCESHMSRTRLKYCPWHGIGSYRQSCTWKSVVDG
jgi:hypothetical protein